MEQFHELATKSCSRNNQVKPDIEVGRWCMTHHASYLFYEFYLKDTLRFYLSLPMLLIHPYTPVVERFHARAKSINFSTHVGKKKW